MFRTRLFALLACMAGGVAFVIVLYIISNYHKNGGNGFVRELPSHKIFGVRPMKLDSKAFSLAGLDNANIYLSRPGRPNQLVVIDSALRKSSSIIFKAPYDTFRTTKNAKLLVNPPFCFLTDGIKPAFYSCKLSKPEFTNELKVPNFSGVVPLSCNSSILRSSFKLQNVLVKQTNEPFQLKIAPELLQKQIDGIFCTDGDMIKVPNSDKIFYVYYYRNEFFCADTNLNLLYRGRTIDTTSRAKIEVATIKSENQITLASPPVPVNRQCSANENYLFIRSALSAENEPEYILDRAAIIDVYSVKNGKYLFSLEIPFFDQQRLTSFKVFGNTLIALFGNYLYKYKLNF